MHPQCTNVRPTVGIFKRPPRAILKLYKHCILDCVRAEAGELGVRLSDRALPRPLDRLTKQSLRQDFRQLKSYRI